MQTPAPFLGEATSYPVTAVPWGQWPLLHCLAAWTAWSQGKPPLHIWKEDHVEAKHRCDTAAAVPGETEQGFTRVQVCRVVTSWQALPVLPGKLPIVPAGDGLLVPAPPGDQAASASPTQGSGC